MQTTKASLEYRITDLIAMVLPWIVPAPTAYIIARASMLYMDFPLIVAGAAALGIEGMGFVTSNTALTLRQYNQAKRKTDPKAPFVVAAVLVAAYVAVAILLTVFLDVSATLRAYAGGIFPFLSLIAMVSAALRHDHKRRLSAIVEEKAERKAERQAKRQNKRQGERQVSSVKLDSNLDTHIDTRLDRLVDAYVDSPDLTPTEASRLLGVSRQTVYSYLDRLENAGRISRNGKGVQVL